MSTRHTYADPADLVPVGEAARRLGVSVDTIRRWDKAGKINVTRTPGGQRRIAVAEIERLLDVAA